MFGEAESVRLEIAGIIRPIVGWGLNKEGELLPNIKFKDGTVVYVVKSYDKIELEQTLRPGDPLFFFVIWREAVLAAYTSEAGLLLVPYLDGFVRVGILKILLSKAYKACTDWSWGGGERQKILFTSVIIASRPAQILDTIVHVGQCRQSPE